MRPAMAVHPFAVSSATAFPAGVPPSATTLVPLFAPYCGGVGGSGSGGGAGGGGSNLEAALTLLQQGYLIGVRSLKGGQAHRYELRWSGALAPLDPTTCVLSFPQRPAVSYRFQLPAHRLVMWLQQCQGEALPEAFWRWLILGIEQPA